MTPANEPLGDGPPTSVLAPSCQHPTLLVPLPLSLLPNLPAMSKDSTSSTYAPHASSPGLSEFANLKVTSSPTSDVPPPLPLSASPQHMQSTTVLPDTPPTDNGDQPSLPPGTIPGERPNSPTSEWPIPPTRPFEKRHSSQPADVSYHPFLVRLSSLALPATDPERQLRRYSRDLIDYHQSLVGSLPAEHRNSLDKLRQKKLVV